MKQGANSQNAYSTYIYIAIRVALILAIVCIAINTWVLWNVYRNRGDVADPTLVAVEALGDDLGGQIASIEQRLLVLEQKIYDLSHVGGNSEEVLSALAKLDVLEKQLDALLAASRAEPDELTKIMEAIVVLQQSVDEKYALVISAIANLEHQIENRIEQRFIVQPSNVQNGNDLTIITVRRGDTIWDLASQFENPPSRELIDRIMSYNMIMDPTKLQIGQKIVIPQS